jgi:acetyl CoA:N6-hydroxylysine acetyl transferase
MDPLWCKNSSDSILYSSSFIKSLNGIISFRSFDVSTDLNRIHEWVNLDYAHTFWQMRGSIGLLRSCYQCIQQNPYSHSFIGQLNDQPVCQFDVYKVAADELAAHVDFQENDCGFHLLMAPVGSAVNTIHGLTTALIHHYLKYYFSQVGTGCLFAEPDAANQKSIQLLEKAGFEKIKNITMSYKKAQLYQLTKNKFICQD